MEPTRSFLSQMLDTVKIECSQDRKKHPSIFRIFRVVVKGFPLKRSLFFFCGRISRTFFLWGWGILGGFVGQISVWNFKDLENKVYKFSSPPSGTTTPQQSHLVSSSSRGKRGRGSCSQAWFQWCSHLERQWVLGCEVWATEIFLPPNQPKITNPHLRKHEKPPFFLGQKTPPKNLTRKNPSKTKLPTQFLVFLFWGGPNMVERWDLALWFLAFIAGAWVARQRVGSVRRPAVGEPPITTRVVWGDIGVVTDFMARKPFFWRGDQVKLEAKIYMISVFFEGFWIFSRKQIVDYLG